MSFLCCGESIVWSVPCPYAMQHALYTKKEWMDVASVLQKEFPL